ncbi:NRDE family protein [Pelagicoccus sp. SDUM812002]|uniref:NRDE family protein n=1 Tax=Pelagicoccus sp. SDUM812002 TaxID=3041266 RepID=UPI00280EF37A|nr:NRDE family protein [Pelagicoccus sp. SDUM812002]MDQ8185144.1 NRDE family protein [Pelagicoccus sp. SDUM812002]
MCTATWSVGGGNLSLYFNRDERKSRSEAVPPVVMDLDGTRLIAAIDPDGGGTWLAINEYGLCVFLLNNYGSEAQLAEVPINPRSRGNLPITLASCSSRSKARAKLEEESFGCYRPFLVAIADAEGIDFYSWSGKAFRASPPESGFVTTSSYRTDEIQKYRELRYKDLLGGKSALGPEDMKRLHIGTPHSDAAFNPMMLRRDSRTRSVSHITVDDEHVSYHYQAVKGEDRSLRGKVTVSLPRNEGVEAFDRERWD